MRNDLSNWLRFQQYKILSLKKKENCTKIEIATCAKWILSAIFNKSFGHCWESFGQNGITRNHVTADKNDNICNRNNCKKSIQS